MPSDPIPQPGHGPVPYPSQYVSSAAMKNGGAVEIRPIRPDDEPLMVKFHGTLSDRTVYSRYFGTLSLTRRVAHERLAHICACDYDREMVLVVEHKDGSAGDPQILGVGRLNKLEGNKEGEVAVLISDQYQGQGLGTALLKRLLQIARDQKLSRLVAEILPDNLAMQHLLKQLGFRLSRLNDPDSAQAVLDL